MRRRLLDVTAYTTFDFLDARAEGVDWTDEAVAVLDVDAPKGEESVTLAVELDPSDLDGVERHVDRLDLSPEQARTLADELGDAAADAESGGRESGRRG